jgi:UDP-glucose 4-epimerase
MNILVTGGAGYIGSHTCVALAEAGHELVIFDNLCNSYAHVIERLKILCGQHLTFVEGDVRDSEALDGLFSLHSIDAVMHFAGLKAAEESIEKPLVYYDNNVSGSLALFKAMGRAGVKTLVFSSSAMVYGEPPSQPICEHFPRTASNPYGHSKLVIEEILAGLQAAEPDWRVARLRYFNPAGAHESGLIGEEPRGAPNNLMPYIAQVAEGKRAFLNVWGGDYPTPDGTGVRDYIHVCDLASGHVSALEYLQRDGGLITLNLGTGQGRSVLEMVAAFEEASGRPIPYRIGPRRSGDSAMSWADPTLAQQLLNWKTTRDPRQMCVDAWRWQQSRQTRRQVDTL